MLNLLGQDNPRASSHRTIARQTGSRIDRPLSHRTIVRRMCSRATGRHPPKIGRLPLRHPTSGPRATASPRMRRLLSRRTIVQRMCSRALARHPPKIGRILLRLPTNGHRRMSSRGARLASNPTVPRLHHRHKKIGPQYLVLNRQATSMLLPRTIHVRQIRPLRDRTIIRLTRRRRARRRTSCPRTSQLLVGFFGISVPALLDKHFVQMSHAEGRDGNSSR
jgi:hypothetical protein